MKYNFNPFVVDYGEILSPIDSFKGECILAINKALLFNEKNLPVVVMMSGGIDSELVAESLLLAGVKFHCVIGRLLTSTPTRDIIFNSHDYCIAEKWCRKNNIYFEYCDIDIFKQNSLLCDYAIEAKSFSPQYACHMFIMKWCSERGYFFFAGNGEMDIVLYNNEYCMMDEQREFTLDNFCNIHSLEGCFQFWKQDGRLISAFLRLPTVIELMNRQELRILDYKHRCFADEFNFEDRRKYTGFEYIQEWDYHLRNYLKSINGEFDSKFYTPISLFKYEIKGIK